MVQEFMTGLCIGKGPALGAYRAPRALISSGTRPSDHAAARPRRNTITSLVALCTVGLLNAQGSYSLDNDFEVALGTASLTTRTARFDPEILRFFAQSEFPTSFYSAAHGSPWRTPFFADMWRSQFSTTSGAPSDSVAIGGRMIGNGSRRTLLANPIQGAIDEAKKPNSLRASLELLKTKGILKSEIPDLSKVPAEVQQGAAVVLRVAVEMLPYRRAAFSGVADLGGAFLRTLDSNAESADPAVNQRDLALFRSLDMNYLFAGGHDLSLAGQYALSLVSTSAPSVAYDVRIPTDWGQIVLTGGSNSTHEGPTLLLIDTGGDDTYLNLPSNQSTNNWASVVVDAFGNDKYLSDQALAATSVDKFSGRAGKGKFGPGSACFGVGLLFDGAGNDTYRSHRPGLGSASMGVAALFDREGDDTYDAYADSIGFGKFGVGVLEDGKGKDSYSGFSQVEGCGQTGGFGMVIDRDGNDSYVANDTVLDFASPQSAEHNANMSQGCGNGRRADDLDGHSLSGGIGVLYDARGDDTYTCGVFGQGVGYWEGVGMLWDSAGNDKYSGQWYVQGASAHFAIGYLEDESGNDEYVAPMNMAMGAGHDFGFGMLIERAGNDVYRGPNLSLGAGNANGLGFLLDRQGDDRYESSGITLGKAAEAPKGTLRERALCLGIFMDLQGTDTFPSGIAWAKNGQRVANWTDKGPSSSESQVGIFWDR